MKTAIIYASKTGTTKKCAEILSQKLNNNAKVINVENETIDLNEYDLIIIGSPIRIGMMHKKIKQLIKDNFDLLKDKNVGYYVCCGFEENKEQYFSTNIPKDLLDKAVIRDSFGGEMDIEKQKGFDKFIAKLVSKNNKDKKKVEISLESIDNFIKNITNISNFR